MDPIIKAAIDNASTFAITLGVEIAFFSLYLLSTFSQLFSASPNSTPRTSSSRHRRGRITIINRFGLTNQILGISSALFGLLPILLSSIPCQVLMGSCLGYNLRRTVVFYFMIFRLHVIKPLQRWQIWTVGVLLAAQALFNIIHCTTFSTLRPGGILCVPVHLYWTGWPSRILNAVLELISLVGLVDRYRYIRSRIQGAVAKESKAVSYVSELRYSILPLLLLNIAVYIVQYVTDGTPKKLLIIYIFEVFISIMMYVSFTYGTRRKGEEQQTGTASATGLGTATVGHYYSSSGEGSDNKESDADVGIVVAPGGGGMVMSQGMYR
ncbi:hypothetical protein HK102_007015 [Quaeritorhiza haematococci]|nr:hypothetical protein HK102_007015 [Quaeritorhiza haematococci]